MTLTDAFLHNKKIDYALKMIELSPKDYVPQTFEYVGLLLKKSELAKINERIIKVIEEFTSNLRSVKSFSNRYSTTAMKMPRSEYIAELPLNLNRSTEDWADVLMDISQNQPKAYKELVSSVAHALIKSRMPRERSSNFFINVEQLAEIFVLDQIEKEIMVFLYLVEVDTDASEFFARTKYDMLHLFRSVKIYCHLFNLSPQEIKVLFGSGGRLRKTMLIELDSHCDDIKASSSLCWYLSTNAQDEIFDDYYQLNREKNLLSIDDHILPVQNKQTIQQLLKGPSGTNLLLYGSPGTGKTEFTKSLAQELNCPLYFIKQHDEAGKGNLNTRKSAIVAAQNLLPKNAIVVIDEAEDILKSASDGPFSFLARNNEDSKAWINDLLETNTLKLIWIVNGTSDIDQSTKRRFSFSQEFKKFNQAQRLKIWKTAVKNNQIKFLSEDEVLELSQKYEINAGGIALALEDVKKMKDLKTHKSQINALENLLEQHVSFVFNTRTTLNGLTSHYDKDLINLNTDPQELVSYISQFYQYIERQDEKIDFSNLSLLFHGAPGTGKTEFAKYLAQQLGKELLVKRLSDIRSMWYGQSLVNIAQMFTQASAEDKILFLDEADSMFVERGQGNNVHVEAETNELLTQMENFKGVLICSSNFQDSMDQAVMRRFSHKIKFDYLKPQQVEGLFLKMFCAKLLAPLTSAELTRLTSLNFLTPGDFKVVQQKTFFNPSLKAKQLIDDLQSECGHKRAARSKISL